MINTYINKFKQWKVQEAKNSIWMHFWNIQLHVCICINMYGTENHAHPLCICGKIVKKKAKIKWRKEENSCTYQNRKLCKYVLFVYRGYVIHIRIGFILRSTYYYCFMYTINMDALGITYWTSSSSGSNGRSNSNSTVMRRVIY